MMKKVKYRLVIIIGVLSLSSVAQASVVDPVDVPGASKDDKAIYLAENKPNRGTTGSARRRGAVVVEDMATHQKEKKVKRQNNRPTPSYGTGGQASRRRGHATVEDVTTR